MYLAAIIQQDIYQGNISRKMIRISSLRSLIPLPQTYPKPFKQTLSVCFAFLMLVRY